MLRLCSYGVDLTQITTLRDNPPPPPPLPFPFQKDALTLKKSKGEKIQNIFVDLRYTGCRDYLPFPGLKTRLKGRPIDRGRTGGQKKGGGGGAGRGGGV